MKLSKIYTSQARWPLLLLIAVIFALYLLISTQMPLFQARRETHFEVTEQEINRFSRLIDNLNIQLKPLIGPKKNEASWESLLPTPVQLNDSQAYRVAEKESNLPVSYWERWKRFANGTATGEPNKAGVQYCENIELTDPLQVKYNNRYWQMLNVTPPGGESIRMYLHNAYYDDRVSAGPVVKLISVNNQEPLGSKQGWWCLLWFEKTKAPVLMKVSEYSNMWNGDYQPFLKPGVYHPQLISCPVPKQYASEVPSAVSLQSHGECNQIAPKPSNVLRVIHNKRVESKFKKGSIGVCVQAFRFGSYDMSVRLVEWLEMMRLLGADQVYLYVYAVNENMAKVLRQYQSEGFVDWRPMTLAGNQVNLPSLYNLLAFKLGPKFWPQELIELNDCLYRNMYRHDYLAVIDIDEVILPQKVTNWHQLIEQIESRLSKRDLKRKSHYSSRHSHVCEVYQESNIKGKPIPEYLYMSRHIQRATPLKETPKCFVRTDLVTLVHNHFPLRCINGATCNGVTIDSKDGVLMHYRRNQSNPELAWRNKDCPVHDHSNWRYFDQMLTNVQMKLQQIFVN